MKLRRRHARFLRHRSLLQAAASRRVSVRDVYHPRIRELPVPTLHLERRLSVPDFFVSPHVLTTWISSNSSRWRRPCSIL